jgi:hypothetical protein
MTRLGLSNRSAHLYKSGEITEKHYLQAAPISYPPIQNEPPPGYPSGGQNPPVTASSSLTTSTQDPSSLPSAHVNRGIDPTASGASSSQPSSQVPPPPFLDSSLPLIIHQRCAPPTGPRRIALSVRVSG